MATAAKDATPTTIPETMKRLVLTKTDKDLANCEIAIEEVPVPTLKPGQVLVKMVAAPVNPSDYHRWQDPTTDCPQPIGIEGCGVVVKTCAGGSLMSSLITNCKVGQHVGVVGIKDGQGSYSEYVAVTPTDGVLTLPDDLPIENAASFFVNPYTALAIMDTAVTTMKSKAFIHTAAASQLGQMIVKKVAADGDKAVCEPINVVRRTEQAELLQKLGAKHIINTSDEDWKEQLKQKVKELDCTVAFDAVAGSLTTDLLDCLPDNGTVLVYGALSGKIQNISPLNLIYRKQTVKGFLVGDWIQSGGPLRMIPRMIFSGKEVNSGLYDTATGWSNSSFQDTTMENVKDDLVKLMAAGATGQKLRIRISEL